MDYMATLDDNAFDFAIVDPPYGNNDAIGLKNDTNNKVAKRTNYKVFENVAPDEEYFRELKRVSKNQIVWGANFFGLTGGYLCWNKNGTAFGQAELAYVSSINSVKVYEYTWNGMLQGNMKNKEIRIHPTQKPVQLYKYLLNEFVKKGDKILDTHLGSGSIAIACHDMKFDLVGCEIDKEYFDNAVERFERHKKQLNLF